MKTIYLAGKMSGVEKWNFPAFDRNRDFLKDCGWNVISPADLDRAIGFDENDPDVVFTEQDFHLAMKRDYEAILKSDAIAFMPGWENSTGAKLERDFAGKLGLTMYRVDADKEYLEREMIIGLCGFAQVGKDCLAKELVSRFGFERRAFADTLRNVLYELNPIIYGDGPGNVERVKDLVDAWGYERAKIEHPEIRALLQRLGTEAGRKYIAEDIWSRVVFENAHGPRLVIPDVRFPNEAKAIQDRGGIIVRITREGYTPINAHVSEIAYTDQDYILVNDGSPEDLYKKFLEKVIVPLGWN